MSAHKHKEHLQQIKEKVQDSSSLSHEEKSQTIERIEEWIAEDKAEGIIYEELIELAQGIKPILAELGLI